MDVAKYYNDGYDVEVPEDDDFDLEYIDLDEEEVLRHEVQREKTLKEAWLNLKGKQISLAFVRTAIRARETKDKIDNIVKGLEEKAQIYGKDYIVSKDVKKSAIKEYKRALEELTMDYSSSSEEKNQAILNYEDKQDEAMNKKSDAISKKKKMQASKEYKKYLNDKRALIDEINHAIEDEDYETEQIKRKELSDLKKRNPALRYDREILEADKTIKEMEDKIVATKKYLEKLDEIKNERLDEIEKERDAVFLLAKQSFWQRFVGSIVNKFNKAGKVKDSIVEQIKGLTAKIKEKGAEIIEDYEEQQEKKAQVREKLAQQKAAEKAEKAEERAQAKILAAEARRKHKEDIIKDIERRIQETENQLETARLQRAQYTGKNMTPALEGGNGNIVPFERD